MTVSLTSDNSCAKSRATSPKKFAPNHQKFDRLPQPPFFTHPDTSTPKKNSTMGASEARKRKRAELAITKEGDIVAIAERAEKKAKLAAEEASKAASTASTTAAATAAAADVVEPSTTEPKAKKAKAKKEKKPKKPTAETAVEKRAKAKAELPAAADTDSPDADPTPEVDSKSNPNKTPLPAAEDKKHRFIVFIGNLPFHTTQKLLTAHFAPVAPTSIRLPFPKETPTKCKGYAFLEFEKYDRMKLCLAKFHHSMFEGRKLNVELTAGGGGNTKARKEKLATRNGKLDEERRNRSEKEKEEGVKKKEGKAEKGGKSEVHPSRRGRME